MTLQKETRQDMVRLEFDRAWKILHEAEINLENELWNVVGNRVYYAVFHGVSGLLIKNGLKVGSHKGASVMFARHFVQTGKFGSEFSKLYGQLQSIREKADYNNTYELTAEEAKAYYAESISFLEMLQAAAGIKIPCHKKCQRLWSNNIDCDIPAISLYWARLRMKNTDVL